jgi:DNA-binding response OmpR family regulator
MTDLVMPEGDGLETIRLLRNEFGQIPIIAMSGAFGNKSLEVARLMGADQILPKPIQAAVLLARVREVLDRRDPIVSVQP